MSDSFGKNFYEKIGRAPEIADTKERIIYRFFEMLPGLLIWSTLFLVLFLSWKEPIIVAFFILIFDIYWLFRTIYFAIHLKKSFSIMNKIKDKDWILELEKNKEKFWTEWENIHHLIVLPFYNEGLNIVRAAVASLANDNYPLNKLIVVLAVEERAGDSARIVAESVEKEFSDKFIKLVVAVHPKDIAGEIAGKGSNCTWAVKKVRKEVLDVLKISYKNIIVSNFDIDTTVLPNYFARLTYAYLVCDKPFKSSFQPIPLFMNNIWEAPAFARLSAFASTFWQM